ncbi:hypothetical protein, partial [Bradyrhizobium sp.]|uniref:hypothetical protein n=1 Tax=Bradyrhizobium sp. TaxID=376 RepID=UPI00260B3056
MNQQLATADFRAAIEHQRHGGRPDRPVNPDRPRIRHVDAVERRTACALDIERAGSSNRHVAVGDRSAVVERQDRADADPDRARRVTTGTSDRHAIQRRPALALDVQRAATGNRHGAVADIGAVLKRQDRTGFRDGSDLDRTQPAVVAGAGHRDAIERRATCALDVEHAAGAKRNCALGDGGSVRQHRLGAAVDLQGSANVGDIDIDIEGAAGKLDRAGIGDAAVVLEIAALLQRQGGGILQHAVLQDFGEAADAEVAEIFQDRIGIQVKTAAANRQRIVVVEFRGSVPQIVHGHGSGERR